jgi:nucleoside-diphosphate-sugar epimerase
MAVSDYERQCIATAQKCASQARKAGVKKFVEVSTAQVYEAGKKPSKEGDKLAPWTNLAKARLKSEQQVQAYSGLPWVVLRPSTVYGPGDLRGLTPRLCVAACYQVLNEPMKLLWDRWLKINCVHVEDVARAIVVVCRLGFFFSSLGFALFFFLAFCL